MSQLEQPKRVCLKLHPKQVIVYNSPARFKVVDCGRRFGKTHLAWVWILSKMIEQPGSLWWWVAPLYKELAPATRKVKDITPKEIIADISENQNVIRYIRLVNGSECYFHSADREDSLRGSGLHGMVIDEAAALKEDRWHGELEPSLMDFNGCAMFISTPKGKNWFWKLHCKGLDTQQSLYQSWCFSSYENTPELGGFIPRENIDAIAADMPNHLREQEIEGKFLEGEGVVFRNLIRQIMDTTQPLTDTDNVSIGIDFGKTVDYTVMIALNHDGVIVGFERFNTIDWTFQSNRAIEFCKRFKHYNLIVDASGLGDPIFDGLRRSGLNIQPFKFTNETKKDLIENLSHMIDNGKIWFPGSIKRREFREDLRVLQSELEMFSYEIGTTGKLFYGAPEGYHDDTVIALALACWQSNKPRGFWISSK